ncbi:MAG: hypothetical protein KA210_01340 [Bacteroidia bacterium]|nr:hypothetical protein [Bacteroidia bacterium]
MKQITLLILIVINSYGQSQSKIGDTIVTKSLFTKTIELQNKNFEKKLLDLNHEFDNKESKLKRQISELTSILESNKFVLDSLKNQSLSNDKNITSLGVALSQKQQFGLIIFGFSLTLLLLVYIVLNKKRTDDTKKLAAKQKEIFEKQIQDSQQIADWLSNQSIIVTNDVKNEVDHSFAKRVADEIVRFTTNLSRMDESIKGFKQLSASVRKLEQSLNANHYELENLLNKPYNSGMNIEATIIIDDNLNAGESFITRIIKPQINYKGKLIQAAQVEVSQGE